MYNQDRQTHRQADSRHRQTQRVSIDAYRQIVSVDKHRQTDSIDTQTDHSVDRYTGRPTDSIDRHRPSV